MMNACHELDLSLATLKKTLRISSTKRKCNKEDSIPISSITTNIDV